MKQRRISAAGAVLAIIGLLFIGCNQLADGTEETVKKDPPAPSPSGPPTIVAGDLLAFPIPVWFRSMPLRHVSTDREQTVHSYRIAG